MTFAVLAVICLVAILGPVLSLSRGIHPPVVVGELVVGLILGQTGFRVLSSSEPTFGFLAEIGFALIMLIAGSHVPVRDSSMLAGARMGLLRAVLVGAVAVPAGLGLAALFGTGHGALYAVLLASSSAGLVLPALAGTPLASRSMIELIPQVAVADAACIVLLPFAIDPVHVGRAALGALVVGVASVLVFFVLRTLERSGYRRRVHEVSEQRGLALELRTSLTLLFALAALAQLLHVSVMLAGFGFGLALAAVGEPRRLAKQLFALTEGFFGPIFFVWVGASLDLRALLSTPSAILLGLALGVGALLAHLVPVLTRQPWPVAAITAAQLGVPVAAVTTGTQLGLFGPGEDTAILLGALITIAATGLLSQLAVRNSL